MCPGSCTAADVSPPTWPGALPTNKGTLETLLQMIPQGPAKRYFKDPIGKRGVDGGAGRGRGSAQ